MEFFLGVDGGQSGTTALIANAAGEILGIGTAGPCNHVGAEHARAKLARVVTECVQSACISAGVPWPPQLRSACFGMSGGPGDKEEILKQTIPAANWRVTDDGAIALAGALMGEPGVITIAGTGSFARGRGPQGRLARAGGWGYVFGDEGGAFDIVRQALRACLRSEEGWDRPTALTDMLLSRTGCPNMNAVLHLFYTPEWPRSRVALLAGAVDHVAVHGDEVAQHILKNAAQSLALFAQSVRRQLWPEGETVDCSYVGGVFQSALLLHHFQSLLELGNCAVVPPALGPAAGALIEAYRLVAVVPDRAKLLSSKFRHE